MEAMIEESKKRNITVHRDFASVGGIDILRFSRT